MPSAGRKILTQVWLWQVLIVRFSTSILSQIFHWPHFATNLQAMFLDKETLTWLEIILQWYFLYHIVGIHFYGIFILFL